MSPPLPSSAKSFRRLLLAANFWFYIHLKFSLYSYFLYFLLPPLPSSALTTYSSLPRKWVERRTAEDYNRTAAENGWVAGAHEEEDQKFLKAVLQRL